MARRPFQLSALFALGSVCAASVNCGGHTDEALASVQTDTTTASALTRVNAIRERFQTPKLDIMQPRLRAQLESSPRRPIIGSAVVTRFDRSPGALEASHVRPYLSTPASARVDLPRRASDPVVLEDARSNVRVGFALRGARSSTAVFAGGYALYPGAANGADVIQRAFGEGTEDYIAFETKPSVAELAYDVDVTKVAGLRLVDNTLELLDAAGTPALKVSPPYVVDANGKSHDAKLHVDDCAVDVSVAPPWGRAVTAPGRSMCTVRVTWGDVAYPALVDPAWTTTGSMQSRWLHAAVRLASGKVLVSGGYKPTTGNWTTIRASAEIYDPATGTFAVTGSMPGDLLGHTLTLLSSGKVLLTGGDGDYGMGSTPTKAAALFDEGAGTFTAIASMSAGRRFHTATLLASGKVLVFGGRIFAWGPEGEVFDPATNTFASASAQPTALGSDEGTHTATLLASGKVLLTSGDTANALIYDPGASSFAPTGSLGAARASADAVRLASGKVLVAGGTANGTAEIFDPAANGGVGAFSSTANLAAAGATGASLLASGSVLLVGPGKTAQLFDPSGNSGAGTFALTESMAHSRKDPTVTLLASGDVLVAGADVFDDTPASTVEIYDGPTPTADPTNENKPNGAGGGGSGLPLADTDLPADDEAAASKDGAGAPDNASGAAADSGASCQASSTHNGSSAIASVLAILGFVAVRRRRNAASR
jgi:hypothetical protein